jgi:hypothetical protein
MYLLSRYNPNPGQEAETQDAIFLLITEERFITIIEYFVKYKARKMPEGTPCHFDKLARVQAIP